MECGLNNTYREYPLDKCLHQLIEEQILRNPDKPAVRFEDTEISFAELNDRANRCARYLRSLGEGPDSIVGVLMERSIEMVVALLGILKAGGAYLPLDPTYPREWLKFMLEDAGVSIVFTQDKHKNLVSGFEGTTFCLDSEWDYLAAESGSNLENITTPDNLAYVIYTSGSTGKPKGCMLPHKAICNRLVWMQDEYRLTDQDRVLQKTPFTFDVSVWEFFWPLLSGACLVIAKPEGHKDSNYLVDIIRKEGITTCHFVPSMLRYFISNPNVGKCDTLRQVFTSGETLSFDLMMHFKKKLSAKLHNLYGPTEAAVDVTYWECEERADKKVPIGRPIPNIEIYILDSELNPVPVGQEGELHIGGIGLAKGYLNRPELTAEKFINNPFSTEPEEKLYKTGDKARYLQDGNIEFLGRIDFQVKLRGNRIELGEIETVLRDHDSIEEAVVLIRDEESPDPKLVAYLVPTSELPASKEIRRFVKSKLPDYMVPNVIVPMEYIPVTQHGKLDRGALPWPVKDRVWENKKIKITKSKKNIRASITAVLSEYLQKILDINEITVDDDLFDAGATSLTMVQLAEEIHKQYGVSVPVDVFLDDPTVKGIVDYLCKELEDKRDIVSGKAENTNQSHNLRPIGELSERKAVANRKFTGKDELTNELVGYFTEVLGTEGLKADDDLFDIGATSLTMVQIVEKIQKEYHVSIPVEMFLDDPTISAVADYIVKNLEENLGNGNGGKLQYNGDNLQTNLNLVKRFRDVADSDKVIELQKVDFKQAAYYKGAIVRDYVRKTIPFNLFSRFLSLLKQETVEGKPKYLYPSAGGLNAVQTYIYVKENAVEGVNKGIYYYHPEEHGLYLISDRGEIDRSVFFEYDRPAFDNAGFVLFFITQLEAIKPVYQMASPTLVTLEAGYMGQLMLSRQSDFNLGLCPVGGVDFDRIGTFFKLDESHRFIHCMLGGVPNDLTIDRNEQEKGMADYLQKMGKNITEHFQNYTGDQTFVSFLDIDWNEAIKSIKYLNKEEHDLFHEKHLNIRRFSGGENVIALDKHHFQESDYLLRSSKRDYLSKPVPFEQFSKFLSLLKQEDKEGKSYCLYPSLSGMYGIQAYLYIKENGVEGLTEGIYYYHPVRHALVLITSELSQRVKPSYTPFNRKHYQKSAFCLFLIGNLDVMKPIYKDESLYFALLEAGYLGQLLMDKQAEFGIGICPIGGLNFDRIRSNFKLDDGQVLLHSFTGGVFEQEIPEGREFLEVGRGGTETEAKPGDTVQLKKKRGALQHDLAIVGISGRYPGAESLDEYWENLKRGKSSIRELPESRMKLLRPDWRETVGGHISISRGGFLKDIDCFDSLLFNISPSEARTLDPQERLLMEVAWECLENAGYTAENLIRSCGKIGVFVGVMWNEYQNQSSNPGKDITAAQAQAFHSSIANRISYFFNFNGPSVALNTSCSSALTAIHFACESIKRGECDAALVGGVNLITHSYHQELLASLDQLSKDAECRPFGAQATGWLAGEGVGAILIKPIEDAKRDKDYIYGVIKGTAIGHSGRTARFGVPSSAMQAEAIKKAIADAGVSVESISYIEAAAAGASIADASEMDAIKKVFRGHYDSSSPLLIGSVKANIGHLESASAMSQITKVLLQMKHRHVAPTINYKPVSPLIKLQGSGLEIVDELKPWSNQNRRSPIRALVNAFGASGTGGHIILEEYISDEIKQMKTPKPTLIPISAATEEQLHQLAARIYEFLSQNDSLSFDISDIGYTLRMGRVEMEERLAIVAENTESLKEKLARFLKGEEKLFGLYRGTVCTEEEFKINQDNNDLFLIAEQWVKGTAIEWSNLNDGNERRVPLPTYPFAKVRHWVKDDSRKIEQKIASTNETAQQFESVLRNKTEDYLKTVFSEVSEIPVSQINAKAPLEKYGINSLMITRLTTNLEKDFGELPKTLFFEYQTIHDLAKYFLENHIDRLKLFLDYSEPLINTLSDESFQLTISPKQEMKSAVSYGLDQGREGLDIAVIGVSGRYPKARTIADYWENLKKGMDCITEIPRERWDYQKYYDSKKRTPGRAYCKWGGFIDDVDKFDSLLFNISPREAELMDPQERLFLETVWHTFEDAGYNRRSLQQAFGGKVGVFVGVMYGEYQLLNKLNDELSVVSSYGSIANRVSYFFDFHGPSMAIDTLCSSSLTALHLAAESIKRGECEAAIAGGVNISLHPAKYIVQSQLSMSSTDGRCRSFGEGGDGFVPGEGVGAVLLKPLPKAIQDGDHIYGVIKATSVNHGGKTNGYTVPNPVAQSNLISEALKKAEIDPRTISYVEAHGTGTSLGDPIEIAGLSKSFGEYTDEKQYCSIGSVKSNIGHLEAAAGVAGLTKVLLQMKYKQLVPSLHSKQLNPNINFEQTPFFVQQELTDWNRPVIEINGKLKTYPRRASISSFGAGGANAHVVIEEYEAPHREPAKQDKSLYIIVLSAKNQERLREYAQQLLSAVREQQFSDGNLSDVAYTLQVGREAMENRLAAIVGSVRELEEKLDSFIKSRKGIKNLYQGQVKKDNETVAVFNDDEELQKAVGAWVAKGKYEKLLSLWVKGLNFDWEKLYGDTKPRRISLPTYPFARERYWLPEIDAKSAGSAAAPIAASIHPLLHQNTSDLSEQRFSSTFTGQEFFLADHVVKGQRLLPGVACLEMARAAVDQAAGVLKEGQTGIRLKNVIWAHPIAVGEQPVRVHIGLFPEDNGEIAYEIYREAEAVGAGLVVYSQGSATLSSVTEIPTLDLMALQDQCSQSSLSSIQCYETFRKIGINYGPGHQGIETVYVGTGEVLAKLSLPASVSATLDQFVLHPSLMDSALQAAIGLMMDSGDDRKTPFNKPALPFALQELEIFGKCTSTMWAFIRYSDGSKAGDKVQKLDIDLCDDQGNVCVRMKGFSSRVLESEVGSVGSSEAFGTLMLHPYWKEQAVAEEATLPAYAHHLVMLCEPDEVTRESIETRMNGVRCLTLQSEQKDIGERFQTYTVQVFEEIQNILKDKPKGKVLIQIVVSTQNEQQLFSGLSGLLKTAQLENPKVIGQLIEVEPGEDSEGIASKLKENSRSPMDNQIRYQDGKRWVAGWCEVEVSQAEAGIPWKDRGIYLITGGAGGLGLIFAKEIAQRVREATLILAGRSPLGHAKQAQLKELEVLGTRIEYKQVDVTRKEEVVHLIQNIREDFGNLNGIIHSAGVIRDNFIIKKTKDEFLEVLAPKVTGLVNLDEVSKDLSLDFFIFFSSGSGAMGNPGQADYSVANAFMDAYARYRNALVVAKQRQGRTLSINWPLWKEGGMHVDEETEKMVMQNMGMMAMQTATGIRALYQALVSDKDQVMVMEGKLARMKQKLFSGTVPATVQYKEASAVSAFRTPSAMVDNKTEKTGSLHLKDEMVSYLKQIISNTLKVDPERMDINESLDKYGLDSIMVMEINNKLEQHFSDLSKTLFFEYSTINDLANYFAEAHKEAVVKLFQSEKMPDQIETSEQNSKHSDYILYQPLSKQKRTEYLAKQHNSKNIEVVNSMMLFNRKPQMQFADNITDILVKQIENNKLYLDHIIRFLDIDISAENNNRHNKDDDKHIITAAKDLSEPLLENENPPEKAIELLKNSSPIEAEPGVSLPFQSFAPFDKVLKNFSFSRLFTKPEECLEDLNYFIEKQIELRKVLFSKEDFSKVRKVIDIGCGTATDLVEIARLNPSIIAHGLTISDEEANYAQKLIREQKLEDRVKIFCEDNTKHVYEGTYDIVLGIQVMHFINEFSQKDTLFKKLSSAMNPDGKILLAEYMCNLNEPIQDPFLNVTVHTVNDWAQLLSNSNLLIDEIIDLSEEIKNFLDDPEINKNIQDLDKATQMKLKKYHNQVVSLQKGWVSYCLIKIVKDSKYTTMQERMEANLEKIWNKKPYKEAKKEMTDNHTSLTYNLTLGKFSILFPKVHGLLGLQMETRKEKELLLIHEKDLKNNPEIAKLIADIDYRNQPAGYERLLYPYYFISSNKDKYLRLIIDQSKKLIIPFMSMDRSIYQELLQYSQEIKQQLLMVDQYHDWLNSNQTRLIPLGVWQNLDLNQFTLKGNKMRKLRYLVEKFKKSGEVQIEEYNSESSLPLDDMRDLMIKWGESKKNIIRHSFICMEDLLQKRLPAGYRAFLTYHNKKLCSVIVIEKIEDGTYLMDQEFYDPKTAPLGHMEYAIIEIIEQLKKENAKTFSLGLTWYPFIFEDHPKKDPEGWAWLKEQHDKQTLLSRIFQQGETNYQFKKKFGVVGEPVFAYLPQNAPFSLLLNYWTTFYQNSLTSTQLTEQINRISLADENAKKESESRNLIKNNLNKDERLKLLAKTDKLEQLDYNDSPLDLMTDSWFVVQSDAVKKRTTYLKNKPCQETMEVLRTIFPFKHIILTARGQIAEQLFYQAYPKEKKKILTTIPWTTTLMHQLKNGFDVIELPDPSVKQPQSPRLFKGEMDLEALKEQLTNESKNIAMAGLEVLNNASGGHPVRLSYISLLKTILQQYQIPLVLDASRIVRNAFLIKQHEDVYKQNTIWDIVRQTAQQAEHIVTSLTKDFAVPVGGLIATNDDQLAMDIKNIQSRLGQTITTDMESMIIQALSEKETILSLVTKQMEFTRRLNDMLLQARVPILQPAYGHALVIDVSQLANGETIAQRKENFLKNLFIETGIRGSIHQVGKQKNTIIDQCIRLAFPLGLKTRDEQSIYEALKNFFSK